MAILCVYEAPSRDVSLLCNGIWKKNKQQFPITRFLPMRFLARHTHILCPKKPKRCLAVWSIFECEFYSCMYFALCCFCLITKLRLEFFIYSVFPQELDLNNPKTFRVFSKPMGAQSKDRLMQFQKKYREWEDPTGKYILQQFWLVFCLSLQCQYSKGWNSRRTISRF